MIYLDTHAVVWLLGLGATSLGPTARRLLAEADDIRIAPMVRLELQYLYEIERIRQPAVEVYETLAAAIGLRLCDAPFFAVAREAQREAWTRDPFDRLIVAQASLHGAPLVTRDASIQAVYPKAVW